MNNTTVTVFTFQSGYILIRKWTNEDDAHLALYIPIWLYSNEDRFKGCKIVNPFTFQSGYILIYSPTSS